MPRPRTCSPDEFRWDDGPKIDATVIVPGDWARVSEFKPTVDADGFTHVKVAESIVINGESYIVTAAWVRLMVVWSGRMQAYRRAVDACLAALPSEVEQ
jgi:hypothetical protein